MTDWLKKKEELGKAAEYLRQTIEGINKDLVSRKFKGLRPCGQ
jgi:hypothetical protein